MKWLSAVLLSLVSVSAVASQCVDIFTGGAGSYSASGQIFLKNNVQISGSGTSLDIINVSNEGAGLSCVSADCSSSGNATAQATLSAFESTSSSTDVNVPNDGSQTLSAGDYKAVQLGEEAELTFSTSGGTYRLEQLIVKTEGEVNFAPGTYWIDKLELEQEAKIIVSGAGTVTIFSNTVVLKNEVEANLSGSANQLLLVSYDKIELEQEAEVKGYLYAVGDLTLKNEASVQGAINGQKITMEQESTVSYDAAALEDLDSTICPASPLVASYDFNEASWSGSGSVLDGSGNDNHGTPLGDVEPLVIGTCSVLDVPSNTGSATSEFDAVDTNIDIDSDVGDTGTIGFWYRSNLDWSDSQSRQLLDASNTANDKHFYLVLENGELTFGIEDVNDLGVFASMSGLSYEAEEWVYVAVTWDTPNDNVKLYLRTASSSRTSSGSRSIDDALADMLSLYIGDNRGDYLPGDSTNESADGQFDDLVVYRTELSSAEIGTLAATTPDCQAADEQLRWYKFEQETWSGANSVLDSSDNTQHATPVNLSGSVLPSPQVSCRALDIPYNTSASSMEAIDTQLDVNDIGERGTISFWYASEKDWDVGEKRQLLDASTSLGSSSLSKYFFLLLRSDGSLRFSMEDDDDDRFSTTTSSTYSFAAGDWVHIAVTWDLPSEQLEIYVNGVSQSLNNDFASGLSNTLGDFDTLYIGDNRSDYFANDSSDNSANGQIDEVRIYNFVQDGTEITTDMNDVETCIDESQVAFYEFEETSWPAANTVLDGSGNNYHGSPINLSESVRPDMEKSCRAARIPSNTSTGTQEAIDTGVDINDVGATGTISFWYQSRASWDAGNVRQLLDASSSLGSSGASKYFFLQLRSDGTLRFYLEESNDRRLGVQTVNGYTFDAEVWKHIAITWDVPSESLNIFIDGVQQSVSYDKESSLSSVLGELDTLYIGDNRSDYLAGGSSGNSADGDFDSVRIYNFVQTSAEIDADRDEVTECPLSLHHIEIEHDGAGLTCEAETIRLRACADEDCSDLYDEDVVVNLSPATGWSNASPTIFAGATRTVTYSNTEEGIVTLAATGETTLCTGTSSGTCNLDFNSVGLDFYGSSIANSVSNQVAESTFSTTRIRAVESEVDETTGESVCQALLTGTQTLSFSLSCDDPSTCLTDITVEGTAFRTTGAVSVNFDASGVANLDVVYPDAGQISLTASAVIDGTRIESDTAQLVVYPDDLVIEVSTDTSEYAAGLDFDAKIYAVGSQTNTPLKNYVPGDLEFSLDEQGSYSHRGMLSYASGNTKASTSSVSYENANISSATKVNGEYRFTANYSEFGTVTLDVRDNGYFDVPSAIPAKNDVTLGLFVPAYFDVQEQGSTAFANSCDKKSTFADQAPFSYLGFPVEFASNTPEFLLTAYNANNEVTQNYQDWNWLTSSAASDIEFEDAGISGSILQHSEPTSVLSSSVDGTTTLRLTNMALIFNKSTTPQSPFESTTTMAFAPEYFTDGYGVCYHDSYDKDDPSDCAQENNEFSVTNIGGANFRWGRVVLTNAFGSEREDLLVPVSTEYFDADQFVANDDDYCSEFALSLSANEIIATDLSTDSAAVLSADAGGEFPLLKGKTLVFDGITVPPFSDAKQGSLLLELNPIGDSSITWDDYLNYNWEGVNDTNNPSAVVTFGQYRGNDRIIHWREVY